MANKPNSFVPKGVPLGKKLLHFWRDRRGNYAVITALMAPVLIGSAGLATEGGLWMYVHQSLQGAADSAALSSATLYGLNVNASLDNQAQSVIATYGYTVGNAGTTVTVNRPPASGAYTGNTKAVEVIVTTQQARLLSSIFNTGNVTLKGRAVALPGNAGTGCVLSLNLTASGGVTSKGNSAISLNQCSVYDDSNSSSALVNSGVASINALSVNVVGQISGGSGITTTQGVNVGISPIADPYANVVMPTPGPCDYNNMTYKTTVTINPGVYCNGIQLNAGAVVTMNPGIYFIDRGSLQMAGGATLQGTGVTIILTSSTGNNYATATINGGATLAITAPTTGPTAGIAIFGDRNMPTSTTFKFNGGDNQVIGGAVYIPKGTLQYAGGNNANTNCTQVIADTVTFVGNSLLKINCSGSGTRPIGTSLASLVE
ncbi:MAG TPA: TadE/TadG family type IV pilus assembly protein [Rhizomicrobium sp.]|nr:TadE/TadG family type IV pilus assembly protein [Rhizomicrobium sp.]